MFSKTVDKNRSFLEKIAVYNFKKASDNKAWGDKNEP
jgi:hypothetical protein